MSRHDQDKIDHWRRTQTLIQWCAVVIGAQGLDDMIRDAERASTVGPLIDPTLYRAKGSALEIDRARLEAARRFVAHVPTSLPCGTFTLGPAVSMLWQALGRVPHCTRERGCIGYEGHGGACEVRP